MEGVVEWVKKTWEEQEMDERGGTVGMTKVMQRGELSEEERIHLFPSNVNPSIPFFCVLYWM